MNKVILKGRLTKDVEMKNGFVQATIAVDKKLSKDKQAEFKAAGKPTADFINLKIFGKGAEIFAQYLQKASNVLVEGVISTGSYEKDGVKIYTTEVLVNEFEFLDQKKETQATQNDYDDIPL